MKQKMISTILIVANLVLVCLLYLFVDFVHRGGFVMVPILFCSSLGLAVIFSKIRSLSQETILTRDFLNKIFESIERQRIKEALELCAETQSIAARVIKSGIMKYDRPRDEIRESMDDAFLYEGPILEENMPFLFTIIQVMPLLGLVGAIAGFIKIFLAIIQKSSSLIGVSVYDVSQGVWEVLICSLTAFVVVIPILLAYNYLLSRIKTIGDDAELAVTEFLAYLMERRMSA